MSDWRSGFSLTPLRGSTGLLAGGAMGACAMVCKPTTAHVAMSSNKVCCSCTMHWRNIVPKQCSNNRNMVLSTTMYKKKRGAPHNRNTQHIPAASSVRGCVWTLSTRLTVRWACAGWWLAGCVLKQIQGCARGLQGRARPCGASTLRRATATLASSHREQGHGARRHRLHFC